MTTEPIRDPLPPEPACFLVSVLEQELDEAGEWATDLSATDWQCHMAADGMQALREKMEPKRCS